jgi:hypothetical protein
MLMVSMLCSEVKAQVINWESNQGKQIVNLNIGGDYGIVGGVGYSHKIEARQIPIWINIGLSTPVGKDILDDYKVKVGGEVRFLSFNKIQFTSNFQFVFRKINMEYIKANNFGNELALTGGWYEASTGVNFNYGIRTGISFFKSDLFLKTGMLKSQDFNAILLLPFYAQLGYNIRL